MATKYAKQTFITVPNRNTLQTVSGPAQIVFVWMCSMQDDGGRCYPSYNYLAEITRFSRNTVIKAIKELESVHMITKSLRIRDNVKQSNLYEVMIIDTEPQPEQSSNGDGVVQQMHQVVQDVHRGSAPGGHRTKSIELNNKHGDIKSPGITKHKSRKVQTAPTGPIAEAYYAAIKSLNLPVRNHNNVHAKIRAMRKELTEEQALAYLRIVRYKYKDLRMSYKPEITEALDIYAKRAQIMQAIRRQSESPSGRRWA